MDDLITTILVISSATDLVIEDEELEAEDPSYEEAMAAINENEI